MGFLVPTFLAGLVLAGIPLVIHLIYRRRAPQVVFAATRFLKVAVRRTQRKRNIDNLLLLVLRTLLLALLAVGLAGPILKHAIGSGRAGSDVVVVLDNSLSMSAVDDSVERFSRAKEALEEVFARMGGGDLVAVIATAPPESRADAAFTADAVELRTSAARLAVSKARGSIAGALDKAGKLLAGSTAANKMLYVITDLQANAFPAKETLSDATRAALVAVPTVIYDCGRGKGRDLAAASVTIEDQGAVAGTPIEVTAKVTSNSPAQETVGVSLTVASERVQRRTVSLAPGGSAEVSMSVLAQRPGALEGFVEVETADALQADNRRYFSVLVRDRIRALILEKERRTPAFDDDAFFLERALDPFSGESPNAKSPFDVTVTTYADSVDLSKYDVVYLMLRSGIETLDGALRAYAAGGGSLIVFACDDESATGWGQWLPARLISQKAADRGKGQAFAIASIDTEKGAFAAFREEPAALYNTIRVYSYWMTEVDERNAKVLVRFDTGDACAVEGASSQEGVVVFALAPVRTMGSLAASQFFLPLVYETTYHLIAASRGGGEVCAGESVRLAEAGLAPQGMVVTSPDGASNLVKAAEGAVLDYTATDRLGCYRVSDEGGKGERFVFAVNGDEKEYDLVRLDAAKVNGLAPGAAVAVADSPASMEQAIASLKPVLAFGDVLLYSVLAIALLECLAANRVPGRPVGENEPRIR